MQEALCFSSSQPRPPHSGSRHPKFGAFPGSVHIQEEPSEAGEILVTSDYSLPPAIHLPSLPQRRQGDRAMAEQAGQGHRARLPGWQDSVLQVEYKKRMGVELGVRRWAWASKCQITPCTMQYPRHPLEDRAISQRSLHLPRSPFPRGRLKPPQFEGDFF